MPPRNLGADTPIVASPFAPLMERVAVPALWMGIGYILCLMTRKPRKADA